MKKTLALLSALALLLCMICTGASAESPFTAENPGTLTCCVFDRSNMNSDYGTAVDNAWTTWIKEKFYNDCHINLEFVAIPRSGSDDVVTTMMAGGNCPDICFTYDASMLYDFAAQGGLAELSEGIEKYGENIKAELGDMLPYGFCSEGQYAIPAKRGEVGHLCSFIRADWLEKIGFETKYQDGIAVFTYDELETILKAWKEQGICEYPLAFQQEGEEAETMSPIYTAFIDYANYTEKDLATLPDFMWPGVKEGFAYLNKLYNEGLVQPDWAVMDGTAWNAWISNGQIGCWSHAYWHNLGKTEAVMSLYAADPTAKVIPCLITNNDGVPAQFDHYSPNGMFIMVPAASKHVDEAIIYLDWQCQYENYEVINYGFAGEHYELVNGNVHDSSQAKEDASARISCGDLVLVFNGNPKNEVCVAEKVYGQHDSLKDDYRLAYEASLKNSYTPYNFGRAIESYGEYGSALAEKLTEIQTKCITCAPDAFDATFEQLKNEYLTMGGQEVIDEKTAVYEEINAQ